MSKEEFKNLRDLKGYEEYKPATLPERIIFVIGVALVILAATGIESILEYFGI